MDDTDALSPDLARELEQVADLIRTISGDKVNSEHALALVRVVNKISARVWERFASEHDLSHWLAVPLNNRQASSVSSFLATLERMSFQRDHDVLTGLANRRLFDRRLDLEIERAIRSRSELCLMLLDLDNFKQINDTYGHPCGDAVLRRLGEVLHKSVRAYDLAARIGGEEFALLFPSTSCWSGLMLGNRVLESFSQETFQTGGESFSMTFSGGISSLALLEGVVSAEKLLASVDTALYAAKRQGKNRVLVAQGGRLIHARAGLVHSLEKQLLFSSEGAG
ncbi:MAG: GGDEF domain-containing protein [Desulfovibrio sp.]|jgi:diguanylate cyclase (GGDEF)-like protein|nr:GGDEF domain-containing protein [Desulfovibrio sp.]